MRAASQETNVISIHKVCELQVPEAVVCRESKERERFQQILLSRAVVDTKETSALIVGVCIYICVSS